MRQPRPFYRQFAQSWYVTFRGKQIVLGDQKNLAWQRCHEIMASQTSVDELVAVARFCDAYLDWCGKNREPATFIEHS